MKIIEYIRSWIYKVEVTVYLKSGNKFRFHCSHYNAEANKDGLFIQYSFTNNRGIDSFVLPLRSIEAITARHVLFFRKL